MNSYWKNFKTIVALAPSICLGARITRMLAPTEGKIHQANVSLKLGHVLCQDGVLYRGRVIPSQSIRVIPRMSNLFPQEHQAIDKSMVFTRTNVNCPWAIPYLNCKGLWLCFGLLISPKKMENTLQSLQQGYDKDEALAGQNLLDMQKQVMLLTQQLAQAQQAAEDLKTEAFGAKKLVDFTRQVSEMIYQGIAHEAFVHKLCEILYQVAGLRRCIAFIYNEDKQALIAQEQPDLPKPWASFNPQNTQNIEEFLAENGHAILEIPLTKQGQQVLSKKLMDRALHHLESPVARRILIAGGYSVIQGKLIKPAIPPGLEEPGAESIITQCFKTGKILVVNNTANPEHPISRTLVGMWKSKTFIAAPIKMYTLALDEVTGDSRMQERIIGVFGMDHDEFPQKITPEVEHQVELLINMAGIGFTLRSYTHALETALGKHLGPRITKEVVTKLLTGRQTELAPQKSTCSVMFTDIVGFTGITQKLKLIDGAKTLSEFLADYRSWLDRFIFDNDGVLDKYIGDAHLAAWGTPVNCHPDDPEKALRCAIIMQKEVHHFINSSKWKDIFSGLGIKGFQIRIGIDTGEVMAGIIGSKDKHEYTVIGDAVNRANRFEGQAGASGILVSEETFLRLSPDFKRNYVEAFNFTLVKWLMADYNNLKDFIGRHFVPLTQSDLFVPKEVQIKIGGQMITVKAYQIEWDRKKWKEQCFNRIWSANP